MKRGKDERKEGNEDESKKKIRQEERRGKCMRNRNLKDNKISMKKILV